MRSASLFFVAFILLSLGCSQKKGLVPLSESSRIVLIGNNLGARMMNYGYFDTELHVRFPEHTLTIRNMCDGGNTPGFRPHPGRTSPWAFPGAEKFQTELATDSHSEGHFESEDEWLTRLGADIIIGFFGYNESFQGEEGIVNFKQELEAFIHHTLSQKYNGKATPKLVLVSPIAFENLSDRYDLPSGEKENRNLRLYTEAMAEVAKKNAVSFVNVFNQSIEWYRNYHYDLTIDGFQLNEKGYEVFSDYVVDVIFGQGETTGSAHRNLIRESVLEKDWMWYNDFKIPNGVHVFGRRYKPFGPDNYPMELVKIRQMTAIRDSAVWKAVHGIKTDLQKADARTAKLPEVKTNYVVKENEKPPRYLYGKEALASMQVAPGYRVQLFASEQEFEDLANPVQLSFDNKGRLWVAVMPSYPHYKPGDAKPDDKILILEDTNNDGAADKQTIFARGLHLPLGFEFAPEGVYVSQGSNLMLLTDSDGDNVADKKEIILSGFDDHDTHHCISAFCADPSGAFLMGEGVFLHSNVETPYGPVRGTNGGFFRYDPFRKKLERTAQLAIPNPWGIAFDHWGQDFFLETSGPDMRWLMPGSIKPRYGVATPKSSSLIEKEHKVRPTSGLEFVSSRHFPDEVQGDILLNNTIGFLGTKQHQLLEDGTGYKGKFRQDLIRSTDGNFRPVDLEFAPDGSLYIADWHNILVGHMQHNARDPLRDHVHGRIYRITYPSRPLLKPANVDGAPITELLNNLKLPEYRTRYRSKRELRERNANEVTMQVQQWVNTLDKTDPSYEHHLLEALWVTWGANKTDQGLLRRVLSSADYHARAAAVRVLRYNTHRIPDYKDLLMAAAADPHGRVRLEAIVTASWLTKEEGMQILDVASKHPLDEWMTPSFETALAHLNGTSREERKTEMVAANLQGIERELFIKGKEIYGRDGYCATCHQNDGGGLSASGFPPLQKTKWVTGSKDRLIKAVLNGLRGPIEVDGKTYGASPMTPFGGLLNDEEVAAVLTYVRNSFGNSATAVFPHEVKKVRASTKNRTGFYSPAELLREHPLE